MSPFWEAIDMLCYNYTEKLFGFKVVTVKNIEKCPHRA